FSSFVVGDHGGHDVVGGVADADVDLDSSLFEPLAETAAGDQERPSGRRMPNFEIAKAKPGKPVVPVQGLDDRLLRAKDAADRAQRIALLLAVRPLVRGEDRPARNQALLRPELGERLDVASDPHQPAAATAPRAAAGRIRLLKYVRWRSSKRSKVIP